MEARTGTGPQPQFQVDKAEPEAPAKAVAEEGTACSSHITARGRLSRAAAAASPHLPKNPHPPQMQQCWHHQGPVPAAEILLQPPPTAQCYQGHRETGGLSGLKTGSPQSAPSPVPSHGAGAQRLW